MYSPSKISVKKNYLGLFYFLVFLYFFTLCGDHLNVQITLFKFKLNNLFAGILLGILFLTRKLVFIPKSILLPSIYIFLSIFLSTLFGVHKFRSVGYLLAFLFEFVFYFIVPFNLMYQFNRMKVFSAYLFSYKCLGIYAIMQLVLSLFGIRDPLLMQWIAGGIARPHAFAYEPSYYALCISAFVMYYNTMFLLRDQSENRQYRFGQFALVNIFLLVSTSTGGFMAYFILLFVCLGFQYLGYIGSYAIDFRSNLKKIIKAFCVLVGAIGCVSFDLLSRYYLKFFILGTRHGSFGERWRGIINAWDTFIENPLLGVGLGGVGPYLYQKRTGIDPVGLELNVFEGFDPTNVLTEVLASLGLVGIIGFILLGRWVFQLFKSVHDAPFIEVQDKKISTALFISLIVVVIELQFNQGLFRNYIWAHTGIVCGYLARLKKEYSIS